jgi:tetratricopeptide (TPR) repeat protein
MRSIRTRLGIGKIAFAGVLCLIVLAVCALSARGQEKTAESRGVKLLREGRFKEAVVQLDDELKNDPGSKRLGIARVKGLLEVGRWQEALADARAMDAKSPSDPELKLLLGDCYFFAFRPADAMREYGPVLDDSRWGETALAKYGNAAVASGDDRAALAAIERARANRRRLSETSRFMEVTLTPDPKEKVRLLGPLVEILPKSKAVADALALNEALSKAGPSTTVPPVRYPDQAKVKEIYGEPCVRGRLDGRRKVWLAFDTGGESTLLNADLARKLNLPRLADATYAGWGYEGVRKSESVLVKSLEVAGLTMRNTFVVVNQRDTEHWTNKAGYIGLGPFRRNVIFYDRRHGHFQLWPAGTPAGKISTERGVTLPILWANGVPIVPVGLMGKGPYPFLLDTGAPFTLFASKYARRLDIRVNTGKFGKLYGLGLSGAFTSDIAEQVTMSVGPHVYYRRHAFVTDVPQRFPVPVYGILGRDVLNDYKIIFDCPGNTVTLLPYDRWLKDDLKRGD